MRRLNLDKVSPERKEAMFNIMANWKNSGKPFQVLEEGLRLLSDPQNPQASAIKTLRGCGSLFCMSETDRNTSRAVLSRQDANFMLSFVSEIRDALPTESQNGPRLATALERACSVLLKGKDLPSATTDRVWGPVMNVLQQYDPSLFQAVLVPTNEPTESVI